MVRAPPQGRRKKLFGPDMSDVVLGWAGRDGLWEDVRAATDAEALPEASVRRGNRLAEGTVVAQDAGVAAGGAPPAKLLAQNGSVVNGSGRGP